VRGVRAAAGVFRRDVKVQRLKVFDGHRGLTGEGLHGFTARVASSLGTVHTWDRATAGLQSIGKSYVIGGLEMRQLGVEFTKGVVISHRSASGQALRVFAFVLGSGLGLRHRR